MIELVEMSRLKGLEELEVEEQRASRRGRANEDYIMRPTKPKFISFDDHGLDLKVPTKLR